MIVNNNNMVYKKTPLRYNRRTKKWVRRKKKKQPKRNAHFGLYANPKRITAGPQLASRKVNFRYVEQQDILSGTSGAASGLYYRANGLYDPTYAVGGHQPLGFDQWMAFYNHYVVIASKITVQAVNSDLNQPVLMGINIDDTASAISSVASTLCEQANCVYSPLGYRDGGGAKFTLSNQVNPLKFLCKSITDDDVQGSASSDPTEGVYYYIWVAESAGGTTDVPVRCTITIDYVAVLKEQKQLGQS